MVKTDAGAKRGILKYRNKITIVDNIRFHSTKEARRYQELKLLGKAGEITDLRLQVPFEIMIGGKTICVYYADFVYKEKGISKVEDVKGMRTPVYRLKKKLVEAYYGVKIHEV